MGIPVLKIDNIAYMKRNNSVVHPTGFGVILCTCGSGRICFNDMVYTLNPNMLLLFTPYSIINFEYGSDDVDGLIVEANVQNTMMLLSEIPVEKRLTLSQHPCVRIKESQSMTIMRFIDILQENSGDGAEDIMGLSLKLKMLLSQTLCYKFMQIYFTSMQVTGVQAKRSNQIFNKFIASVYANCSSRRMVAYYAGLQNMSSGHFAVVVREVSGRSPMYWIELFTMTKIRRLLFDTAHSLKEIADIMGFPDQSTFGRYFKQRERISPSDYRRANKIS